MAPGAGLHQCQGRRGQGWPRTRQAGMTVAAPTETRGICCAGAGAGDFKERQGVGAGGHGPDGARHPAWKHARGDQSGIRRTIAPVYASYRRSRPPVPGAGAISCPHGMGRRSRGSGPDRSAPAPGSAGRFPVTNKPARRANGRQENAGEPVVTGRAASNSSRTNPETDFKPAEPVVVVRGKEDARPGRKLHGKGVGQWNWLIRREVLQTAPPAG